MGSRKHDRDTFKTKSVVFGAGTGAAVAGGSARLLSPLAQAGGVAGKIVARGSPIGLGALAGYGAYRGAQEDNNTARGAGRGAVRALDPSTLTRSPGYGEEAYNKVFGAPDPVRFDETLGQRFGRAVDKAKGWLNMKPNSRKDYPAPMRLGGPTGDQAEWDQVSRLLGNQTPGQAAQANAAGAPTTPGKVPNLDTPTSGEARATLQSIGDKQLSGTLPSPALGRVPIGSSERSVGNMLDNINTTHSRVEEARERRARGDNGPLITGTKPINMRNAESIASGDVNFGNGHAAVQDMYAKAYRARYDVGMYRRTGLTPDVLHGKGSAGPGPQGSLDAGQQRAFNAASQHYADSHMTGHSDKPAPTYGANGDGRRGFQIPKVQAAAQSAKGNKYEGPDE